MTENKKYRSEIAAAVHEDIAGAYKAGVINKATMRQFDELCLEPAGDWKPEEMKG